MLYVQIVLSAYSTVCVYRISAGLVGGVIMWKALPSKSIEAKYDMQVRL